LAREAHRKPADGGAIPQVQPNPAWNRRKMAAQKFRPKRIRVLLVAESPPADLERYFYFEEPGSADPLFEQICEVLFEEKPRLDSKPVYLAQLRRRGVFVVELKPDAPREDEKLEPYVPWLALTLDPLAPQRVVLIGDAYGAARAKLVDAGFQVVDIKVPAPTAGKEAAYRQELRTALVRGDLESLIRPLPASVKAALASDSQAE
jgi:hypothetical protein